ncbi:MAG: rRNA pseudouridine synthase [Proteobacteria bacterium]|nr:rRNA pseudouridine synthase [Pseudomonadota bacterium]
MKIRLQKIIADAGIASRRDAEKIIEEGRVTVNGIIAKLGDKADPEKDHIKIDGKLLKPQKIEYIYIILNKPKKVMCTTSDPEGRETVMDLIKGIKTRIWPVGRLDYHSEGLVLLTNDGELSLRLTHPRYKIEKVYEVKVKDLPDEKKIEKLKKGIWLEDGKTAPCEITFIKRTKENSWFKVILTEGKKRQIRRMFHSIGHDVMKLKRVSIGPIKLGKLPIGSFRFLTEKEITALKKSVGLL